MNWSLGFFPQSGDLLRNEVEEGFAVFDFEEALGLLKTHAGAETAIELDDDGFAEKLGCSIRGARWRRSSKLGTLAAGWRVCSPMRPFSPALSRFEAAFEGSDCSFIKTGCFHL